MFATRKRLAIGLGVLVLVLASLVVVGTALADDPPATGTAAATAKANYRQVFLGKLAGALGISQADLEAKLKSAEIATIDQAVSNGDLAKNPADRMKDAVNNGKAGFLGGFDKLRGWSPKAPPPGPVKKALFDIAAVSQKAIADKLGLQLVELRQQVRAGKTLASLAAAKNLTEQDLYSAAADAVKSKLAPFVTAGKITQARADEIVKSVREGKLIGLKVGPKTAAGATTN